MFLSLIKINPRNSQQQKKKIKQCSVSLNNTYGCNTSNQSCSHFVFEYEGMASIQSNFGFLFISDVTAFLNVNRVIQNYINVSLGKTIKTINIEILKAPLFI